MYIYIYIYIYIYYSLTPHPETGARGAADDARVARFSRLESHQGTEAGSYLRLIDSCITQLQAQGPSGTCNESKEEEESRVSPRSGMINNFEIICRLQNDL